ncbi:MAG: glycosyltransferase [Mycobacteriaceae bacterium]
MTTAVRGRVGVVIVAFNSSATIGACIASCLTDPAVSALVVVDNSLEEECRRVVDRIAERDERVQYRGGSNIGFSRGCNSGAQAVMPAEYIAFVNPDVELTRRLSDLIPHLARSGSTIVSGILRTPGRAHLLNARPLPSIGRELVGAFVGNTRAYAVRSPDTQGPYLTVGQVAGALMLIRCEDFVRLGGFDERYELYYDDVDLSRRARESGGSVLVLQEWGVHHGGVSSGSVSQLAYCVGAVSRARYFHKWLGPWRSAAMVVVLSLAEFVMRTVTRQGEGDRARLRALRMQLQELRQPGSVRVLS